MNHITTSYIITKWFLKELRAGRHVQTEISIWCGTKIMMCIHGIQAHYSLQVNEAQKHILFKRTSTRIRSLN